MSEVPLYTDCVPRRTYRRDEADEKRAESYTLFGFGASTTAHPEQIKL